MEISFLILNIKIKDLTDLNGAQERQSIDLNNHLIIDTYSHTPYSKWSLKRSRIMRQVRVTICGLNPKPDFRCADARGPLSRTTRAFAAAAPMSAFGASKNGCFWERFCWRRKPKSCTRQSAIDGGKWLPSQYRQATLAASSKLHSSNVGEPNEQTPGSCNNEQLHRDPCNRTARHQSLHAKCNGREPDIALQRVS